MLVTKDTIAEQTLATVVNGWDRTSVTVTGQGRDTADTMSATAEVAFTVDNTFVTGGIAGTVFGREIDTDSCDCGSDL
jgi:tRNA C32,U32 (ribose-2'-O)-methylase TrmJ